MSPEDPRATLFTVAPDGSRTPFGRRGIRVRLDAEVWAAVDFNLSRTPWSIQIGVRKRWDGSQLPSLSIVPRAGNVFVATIGAGLTPPSDLQVVPVDPYPVTTEDFFQVRSKYTSGDFDGEHALSQPSVETIDAREFVVQHDDFASVHVRLSLPKSARLSIEVHSDFAEADMSKPVQRGLDMVLRMHASNLVSCLFHESNYVMPPTSRMRGGGSG